MKRRNYSLLRHNTFGINAYTAVFLEYCTKEELYRLIKEKAITSPYLHIGGGSNLLFTKDYPGTILHSCIGGVEKTKEDGANVWVRVGAGVPWDAFVAYCVEFGWYGTENLSLIPGEVGAAAVQNIGAYGVEVKDLITSVETMNRKGEERTYDLSECCYGYRDSVFKRPEMKNVFITYVNFKLSKRAHYTLDYGTIREELEKYPELTLRTLRNVIIDIRRSKLPDPRMLGNAGSFFMNPVVSEAQFEAIRRVNPDAPHYDLPDGRVKVPAGWLIDQCGWKGKPLGRVAMHDRQALVLVNLGGATGADVLALSDAVRASVREKFGVEIYPEVNIV